MSENQLRDPFWDQLAAVRPEPEPASSEATERARAKLSALIAADEVEAPAAPARRRASLRRRVTTTVLLAAAVLGAALVGQQLLPHRDTSEVVALRLTADQTPAQALHTAGMLQASVPTTGSGDVRHLRFRNFSDPGKPVYDLYLGADGTGTVSSGDEPPNPVTDYLTRRELVGLPTDAARLRPAMLELAEKRGFTSPGEVPERGLLRLGVALLTDPATPPTTKKAVYDVLAGISTNGVQVSNLGRSADLEGRPGIGLRFTFPEDAVQTLVVDPRSGALLSDSTTLNGLAFAGQAYLLSKLVPDPPTASPA